MQILKKNHLGVNCANSHSPRRDLLRRHEKKSHGQWVLPNDHRGPRQERSMTSIHHILPQPTQAHDPHLSSSTAYLITTSSVSHPIPLCGASTYKFPRGQDTPSTCYGTPRRQEAAPPIRFIWKVQANLPMSWTYLSRDKLRELRLGRALASLRFIWRYRRQEALEPSLLLSKR